MNKLSKKLTSLVLGIACLLIVPSSRAVAAPYIKFDPTNVTVAKDAEFTVNVKINSDSTNVTASDVTINFAASDLLFVSASNGQYFPVFTSAHDDAAGLVELHAYTLSSTETHTGAGTLATIRFKAKKGSGSSSLSIACTANGTDTTIYSSAGANIVDCSQKNQVGVSYTGTPTSTNSPTATSIPGNSPTPTQIPVGGGGNTVPTCANLYTDISSAVGTPLAVTLTCSGTDPDGYLNAAEFTFGDGTKQTVEKNAGSPGSIATTHTYTTIGTLGASCRVRDNNNVWSSVPASCNKVISIRQRPVVVTTSAPSVRTTGGGGGYTYTVTATPTATPWLAPTAAIVQIVEDTPVPTETQEEITPEPTPAIATTDGSLFGANRTWWIVGGIIAILLAFLLLRRRGPKDPPNIPIAQGY